MNRPNLSAMRTILAYSALAGAVVAVLTTAGFIASPGGKAQSAPTTTLGSGVVDIDGLMKTVLELNNKKQHKEALDMLMTALDNKSDDPLLRALLLQTFDMFLQEEVSRGQQAVKKNPKDVESYGRVSGAIELMGDDFRAMEVLLNGILSNQDSTELWMKIGRLELKASRPMEALDVFKEVIRLDPKNSDALNNAAFILSQNQDSTAKDLATAEIFAKSARKLDPKNPEYIDTLAEVFFRKGNHEQALSLIKEAIDLAPEKTPFKDKLKKFGAKQWPASLTE